MDAIKQLKTSINLLDHISKYLWTYKIEALWYRFHSSKNDKTASLLVFKDQEKWYFDYSWRFNWWTIIDFQINYLNLKKSEAIKNLCEMYWIKNDQKKVFKKSVKRYKLVEDFEKYRLKKINTEFKRFLWFRGFDFDLLQEFETNINKFSKEIWFCENQFVDKNTFKDIIIFPNYNDKKELIWWKIRRCDWEKIISWNTYIKSISISKPKDYEWTQKFSTWLLFDRINQDKVIITEWETDYLILKILWFKSIIWNLWWVWANTTKIQKLVKNVKKIICLYDNDPAWIKWTKVLQKKIWRPIRKVFFPKIDWLDKYDINDLFNQWYRKKDFDKLIKESDLLDDVEKEKKQKLFKKRFFYDDTKLEYFDIKNFSFQTSHNLSRHLYIKPKELEELRRNKKIPSYEWVCYFDWWKKWFYNLLDKSEMLQPSNNPDIHEDIWFLIWNICNNDQYNIEWLMKTILYKYTHLNDSIIPAVVFHWNWWTWKGLFTELLIMIFGEKNTLSNLTQEHLDSRFSTYSWQKLIVEYNEVWKCSISQAKKNLQKLKNLIFAKKIQIEKKQKDVVSVENIAWFLLSSNDNKPIHLDSTDSWNRRFSIIRTSKNKINKIDWWRIFDNIQKKENIENFLAYLFDLFPDIQQEKWIFPLENEDKKDLEFLSETVWNLFFKWIEKTYPNINKITNKEREFLLEIYRSEIWESEHNDDRYKIQYFNSWLSMKYKPTVIHINWQSIRWYLIDKKVKWIWCFPKNFFGVLNKKIKGIL